MASCIPCAASSTLNPTRSKFYDRNAKLNAVGLSVPSTQTQPGISVDNPYIGYTYPIQRDDERMPAYQSVGGYGAQQNCFNEKTGPQNVYTQRFVSPTLKPGAADLTSAQDEPSAPLCTLPCGGDFGFIASDERSLTMSSQQAMVNNLTIGTSLRLNKACAPLLTTNPPAIFPLECPTSIECVASAEQPMVNHEYLFQVFYTVNAIISRLQEVGIMANFTASRGQSVFRTIGRTAQPGVTSDGVVVDHMWPNSNASIYNPPGNSQVTCRIAPRICLQDAYEYLQYLQEASASMQANPDSDPAGMATINEQLQCMRQLVTRWPEEFGNVNCIDERTFVRWYEHNCYQCY